MNNYLCFLFLYLFLALNPLLTAQEEAPSQQKAITYKLCGRLGNNLITYLCAKWIALKYDLPLLYVPFPYSDQFAFHDLEPYLYDDFNHLFPKNVLIKEVSQIPGLPDGTLIEVNFLRSKQDKLPYTNYKKNPEFLKMVRKILKPKIPVQILELPKDRLNILVHVRTGGGFDSKSEQLRLPNKFPPKTFYISAIESLSQLFDHPLMYVHIMTDDLNPNEIVQEYSQALSHLPHIKFGFRKGESGPEINVINDFFLIPHFDCMIRPNSTFTIAAAYLHDFKAILYPRCHVENDEIVLDEIIIEQPPKLP